MVRRIVQTENAPAPVGPYNQAVVASGEMVFASGQVALDPDGTLVGTGDEAAQTKQCLDNLSTVLTAAGATLANVVKTSVFLKDMNDFGTMNNVYATYFDEATAPARACVEVARLPKDVLVEFECIAVIEN